MEPIIDLNQVNDPDKLKSLAYDQIAAKEQAENNLSKINQRLAQVLAVAEPAKPGNVSDEDLGIEDSDDEADAVE